MSSKQLLKSGFVFLALVTFSFASTAQVPGVTDSEIRIGGFAPLTGPNFSFGKMPMNGVEAVFDKVNAAGGVNGRKLVLIRQDDQCDPATTITVVRKLIYSDNVFALIGGSCSNGVLAAKPDIVKEKVPFLNFAAAADSISAPPVENIYTTNLTGPLESKLQLKFAQQQGAKRIAIVAQHDAWGRDRYDALIAEMKSKGLTPVADEELAITANDATAQALKVQAAQPDALVLLVYPKPAAIFLRDAAKIGFAPKLVIGHTAIPDPVAFSQQVGTPLLVANFVTISPVKFGPSDPQASDWKSRMERLFPNDRLNATNLYGIASAQVMVEALQRAGRELTRDKFLLALGQLNNFQVDVLPGGVTCRATQNHQCHRTAAWMKLGKDGQAVLLSTTSLDQ